jgi:hypothetical protein
MTDIQQPPYPSQQPQAPQPSFPPVQEKGGKNILGIIALAVAAVGFIFACIPGALIVGWILLPIGFILGIISLFLKGQKKWPGLVAIIASVVGTIVGVIVFFAVVAASFNNAFGGTESEVGTSEESSVVEEEDAAAEEEPAAEVGTRENPAPLGTPIESNDWTVVINSVNLDATEAVLAENDFQEAPADGTVYIGINYTVTYTGDDAEGQMPAMVGIEYVTAGGNTVDGLDKILLGPEEIDTVTTLYNGASVTGSSYLEVPAPVDGVVAVRPGMIADKVFVAVQ